VNKNHRDRRLIEAAVAPRDKPKQHCGGFS